MRGISSFVSIAALTLAAAGASAANYSIAGLAQKNMTYTTIAGAQAALVGNSAYTGVGSLFVTYASTATTNLGSLCTGSLLNSTTVLTAAHCIFDHDEEGAADPVTGITFFLPSFGERNSPSVVKINASDWAFNALYDNADHTGDIGSGHDVGIFTLSQAASGFATYDIYGGNPLRQFTEVGTGTIGGPKGTNQGISSDYQKRTGTNLNELYGDDLFSDVSHGVVLSDFDDGTAAHDVFGRNLGLEQTGVVGESNSSPGDSGGPEFIDGKIVSVTSFGITGGIFDGYCGRGSTDPYNASGSTTPTALSSCTNSSVGEIAGNTLAAYNLDFINHYITSHGGVAEAVPEPSSWALMVGGFGLVGAAARRSRRKVAIRFS
jgi:secreted trypsin-like serine protease